MRVVYNPANEAHWLRYYNTQAAQTGFGYTAALPYQRRRGIGSLIGTALRSLLPIAKSVGKSAVKSLGKEAFSTGLQIAGDAIQGRNIGEAAEEHGKAAAVRLLNKAANATTTKRKKKRKGQRGRGLGFRPKTIKRQRKRDIFS